VKATAPQDKVSQHGCRRKELASQRRGFMLRSICATILTAARNSVVAHEKTREGLLSLDWCWNPTLVFE